LVSKYSRDELRLRCHGVSAPALTTAATAATAPPAPSLPRSYSFSIVRGALTIIIANMADFAALGAYATRVAELDAAIADVERAHRAERGGGSERIVRVEAGRGGAAALPAGVVLLVSNLELRTPNGRVVLCGGVTFDVAPGQSVLIRGRSGCGKTSLLRAIAGLWRRGAGTIAMPGPQRVAFLPQQPYMALGGSLREQVTQSCSFLLFVLFFCLLIYSFVCLREQLRFPRVVGVVGGGAELLTDEAMWTALRETDLERTALRLGGARGDASPPALHTRCLDVVTRWSDVLSHGEQQRLAVARLVVGAIARAGTDAATARRGADLALVLLDEATAACDLATQARLYRAMRKWLPLAALISVGHNESLVAFHTHHLHFVDRAGGAAPTWRLAEAHA
jgi:ABC-type uncharacterized transport system fused permease/ATPase subunit